MVVSGHVENGKIILDEEITLPEGQKVEVTVVNGTTTGKMASSELPSLAERMRSYIGSIEGMPSDLALNHDHYLHGQPKRQ